MPLILPGNVASATAATGFNVANSCRFNDGDSPHMHKTPGSASGTKTKFTFNCWFKRSTLGSEQNLIEAGSSTNERTYVSLGVFGTDELSFVHRTGGSNSIVVTGTNLLRDVSAWYMITVKYDSTDGTANNRVRLYINGTEVAYTTQTMPGSNDTTYINDDEIHYISRANHAAERFLDGYLAEVCLIDASALAPTSFGEFDEDSGIWKPIDVSGLTFGTNGFYLDFEDSANLGNDANGGTDLTEVNLAAIDQATDTPTNNFATMNPLDNFYGNYTFSEGNCQVVSSSGDKAYVASTLAVSKGKWYFETNISAMVTDERFLIGIAPRGAVEDDHPDSTANGGINFSGFNAVINSQGSAILNNFYGNNTTRFDGWTGIIGMALDLTDGSEQITFSKDGAWVTGSGTTSATFASALQVDISAKLNESTASGFWHLVVGEGNTSAAGTFQINFGNPPFTISSGNTDGNGYGNFEYAVPSGYYSLNTKNLAEFG